MENRFIRAEDVAQELNVSFQCFIKQFVINCLYIFIAVVDIEMSTSSVYIFCSELSAIVIDRAFTDHCTYRSLHFFISHL